MGLANTSLRGSRPIQACQITHFICQKLSQMVSNCQSFFGQMEDAVLVEQHGWLLSSNGQVMAFSSLLTDLPLDLGVTPLLFSNKVWSGLFLTLERGST